MRPPDRLFLLTAALLSAFQVAVGIEALPALALWAYTLAFGVLLVATLLLLIFGLDSLAKPAVVIVAALIPICLALGLVAQFFPVASAAALGLAVLGFAALALSRLFAPPRLATVVLIVVHATGGLTITFLPLWLVLRQHAPPAFFLVSLGGALIGVGGLLLALLRLGHPLLARDRVFALIPILLLAMTAAFVLGFASI